MTKNELDCIFEDAEGFDSRFLQGADCFEDALALKGLSISESYIKGALWVAMKFSPAVSGVNEASIVALVNNVDTVNPASCFRPGRVQEVELVNPHDVLRRDEDLMLIGDVELMQAIKIKAPGFIGLYLVDDDADDLVAWRNSLLFMSLEGTLKRLPVPMKGESGEIAKRCGVRHTSDVVSVVEGGTKIVQRIAKDGWRVSRERGRPAALSRLQPAMLVLGAQSLHVVTDVVPENGFKLVDVVFGPLHL